ncbi:MAG: hypothetical protein IJZ46_04185 [Bacilli bacterium]|nr:hypothetical protein [Bacilli bacterium]
MKKHFLVIIFVLIFIFCPNIAIAARGDLNYNIEQVTINNKNITIKGWAFIHQTNNYQEVYKLNNDGTAIKDHLVKANGGQTVYITVENKDGSKSIEYKKTTENDDYGYNFYYQQYLQDGYFGIDAYNNGRTDQYYYEDLAFEISIEIEDILKKFSSDETIKFYISAENNDYGKRTESKLLRVINITGKSDYIELAAGSSNGMVKLMSYSSAFQELENQTPYCRGYNREGKCTKIFGETDSIYYIMNYNHNNYKNGFYKEPSNGAYLGGKEVGGGYLGFLTKTKTPGKFVVCVNPDDGKNGCSKLDKDNYCETCPSDYLKLAVYGSWIEFEGTNELSFKVKNDKKCVPVTPATENLECNNSKTYTSTCEELTVHTAEGSANVKIEQTGILSSILTPDRIYEGGGFNLGILYTNAIKWSYVGNKPNNELHNAINKIMRDKLYDYESYISGLNIANLKLGGETKDSSFLIKECKTSDENNNYYDKELTVSCVFHFPKSEIKQNGNVNYTTGDSGLGISNKYYTSLGYSGKYEITANIEGMNRIKENYTKEDSSDDTTPWTGTWEDTFTNCEIDVYSLYYIPVGGTPNGKLKYNFIYRPIDISNPFPNRNAGINWYDWWSIQRNKNELKDTYKNEPQYSIVLDNQKISEIKKYNSNSTNGYFDWDTLKNGESTFVNEYFNTKRVGVEQ